MQDREVVQAVWRDYQILHEIGSGESISQRHLSDRVGIALGLTNQILKRLVRKGLVKTSRIDARRMAYLLTPRGGAEKLRLVLNYTRRTISFFTAVRRIICQRLAELKAGRGTATVAIVGTGEVAEAVYLSAQEVGLRLVAVYESDGPSEWFGMPVLPLKPSCERSADAVVVTWLDGSVEHGAALGQIAPVVVEMRELLDAGLATFARRFVQEAAERAAGARRGRRDS